MRLVVQGLGRIRIVEMIAGASRICVARIARSPRRLRRPAISRRRRWRGTRSTLFRQVVELSPMLPDELAVVVQNVTQPGRLADLIAATLPALTTPGQAGAAGDADVKARLARLVAVLTKEAEVLELGSKIQSQVESEVGKSQREYYLREQLKAIQKELGETRRADAGARRAAREDRGGRHDRGGQEGGPARAGSARPRCRPRPPSTRSRGRTSTGWSRCRGASRPTDNLDIAERAASARRGPLGPREGEGAHPRVPRP